MKKLALEYAGAVIRNYRQKFEEKYKRKCTLSDEAVLYIYNNVETAADEEQQTDWILDDMKEAEAI